MKWASLFAALLLLRLLPWGEPQSTAPAPTEDPLMLNETNGSTCAQWLYGSEPPVVEAFQCAGQPDGAEVKFCCGTCNQTRNCSFEELTEDSPPRPTDGCPACPTDGGPETCPPSPKVSHWVRITWFSGGVLATVLMYCAFPLICGRFLRRKTNTREREEEIEVDGGSSVRPSSSPDASTRLAPPSSAGAEGLPSSSDRPAFATCNLPLLEPHAGYSEYVTVMWFPTVPPQNGTTSASRPEQGGTSSPARPSNQEALL
ncbi:Hypothetical predicted protein [Podarcis lilfordi]|uniref:Uncharacterized protein n=1 Tax=Podarcis lilfordi TaxID=74358 RepID=A0AA35LDD4_9SAUR|nr:Hypothetical predicted protein [Podarcis lilfordi]